MRSPGRKTSRRPGPKRLARDVDFAGDDEDAAFVVVGIEREDGAGCEDRFGIDAIVRELSGGGFTEHRSHDEANALALAHDAREFGLGVVDEGGRAFLV